MTPEDAVPSFASRLSCCQPPSSPVPDVDRNPPALGPMQNKHRAHQPWAPCEPRTHQPRAPCDPDAHQPWAPFDGCAQQAPSSTTRQSSSRRRSLPMRRVWQRYSRSSTSLSAPIAPRWLRICSRGMGRRRRLRSRPCSPRSVREYVSTSVRQYVSTPVRQYTSTSVSE